MLDCLDKKSALVFILGMKDAFTKILECGHMQSSPLQTELTYGFIV